MKKTMILSGLVCLCMGAMLCGCGEQKAEPATNNAAEALVQSKNAAENVKNAVEQRNVTELTKALEEATN